MKSYVKLSAEDIATLSEEALKGIEKFRNKRRQELIKACEDYKARYKQANWFLKIFMSKPIDHPKDADPRTIFQINDWTDINHLSKHWEDLAKALAAENRDVLVCASDLQSLRDFAGRK